MLKENLIKELENDLVNEITHMMFYLGASSTVSGLNKPELTEFLSKQAKSEMSHVTKFANLIIGLNGNPAFTSHHIPVIYNPKEIIQYAIMLETQVLENYLIRLKNAEEVGDIDGKYVQLFIEDQLIDSQEDLNYMKLMLNSL